MIGWDWMKKWEMLEFWDGWFLSNHLSYQHLSFFVQNIYNWIIFHLIFYHQLWDLISFRMDGLLSLKHQLIIKLNLQRCWWKLELIHSWEMLRWDQFPVLPFPFHVCRVSQQEIMQEKVVILILKDFWRNMREILKDWKVWDEFGEYLWK